MSGVVEDESSHGAPSGKAHETFSQLVRSAALASTASSLGNGSFTTIGELNSLSPMKVVEIVTGISSHSAVLDNLFFISREGKKIGLSLKAFSESWGVIPHRDSYYDRAVIDDIPRRNNRKNFYDYDSLERSIDLALSQAIGETAMVQLYIYSAFMPKPIAEYIKAILIASITKNGKVDLESECLSWRKILLLDTERDSDYDSEQTGLQIRKLYDLWCKSYLSILRKVKVRIEEHQEVEQPQARNPVLLLHQWSGLPDKVTQGRLSYTRFSELEKTLYYKATSHSCSVSLDWKLRRLLYITVLRRSPLFREGNSAIVALIEDISQLEEGSPDRIDDKVSKAANKAGYYNIDRFLNLQRRDKFGATEDEELPKKLSRTESSTNIRDMPTGKSFYPMDKNIRLNQSNYNSTNTNQKGDRKPKANNRLVKCYNCGESGHYAYNCPYKTSNIKPVSLKSNAETKEQKLADTAPVHPSIDKGTISDTPNDEVEPEVTLAISRSLLTINLKIGVPGSPASAFTTQRIALDTMSSTNLCIRSVADDLHAVLERSNSVVYGLQSSSIPEYSTELEVIIPGKKSAILKFLIIDDSILGKVSDCSLLIGNADLQSIGVEVTLPKIEFGGKGGVNSPIEDLKEIAYKVLCENIDKAHPLPGAPEYQGRLRRCLPDELLDMPEQKYIYEIIIPERCYGPTCGDMPDTYDYSKGLYDRLTPEHKKQFMKEVQSFIDKHYLSKYKMAWQTELQPGCVTFPVVQGLHKNTKCRPCTDARKVNLNLPNAGYEGHSVSDILSMVRSRFRKGYKIVFMDLERAFLRMRHASNIVVKVVIMGKVYYSSRILFGLKHGPCSLSGFVVLLLNAAFSALLGRQIQCHSTTQFANLLPGLSVLVFYDDVLILGEPMLVDKLVHLLSYLAPVIGGNFPSGKVDTLSSSKATVRHLGVNWKVSSSGDIIISCICPPTVPDENKIITISRREVFAVAGSYYDPLLLHPYARLGADWLRHWAGRSPGGMKRIAWDYQWPLSQSNRESYLKTIKFMNSDGLGKCSHTTIKETSTHMVIHCDASDSGYGFTIHTMDSKPEGWNQPCSDATLLESYAGSFNLKKRSSSWHINRKELYSLVMAIREGHEWLKKFSPYDLPIKEVRVFTDNTTAANWASKNNVDIATKSYDRVAIQRLQSQLADIRDDLRQRFNIILKISYIKGTDNYLADELSRKAQLLPAFEDMGILVGAQAQDITADSKDKSKKSKHETALIISTDQNDILALPKNLTSSHKYALHAHGLQVLRDEACMVMLERDDDHSPSKADDNETEGLLKDDDQSFLYGIGNLRKDDIIRKTRDDLTDTSLTKHILVTPQVCLEDLLVALGVRGKHILQEAPEAAQHLAAGSNGLPEFKWDLERSILQYRDSRSGVDWSTYLISNTPKYWVFYMYHTNPLTGVHRGGGRSLRAARKGGWFFKSMAAFFNRMVSTCHTCQLSKYNDVPNQQPLRYRRASQRFTHIQFDFVGPFPNTEHPQEDQPDKLRYGAVMIDEATRICMVIPCGGTSAQNVIQSISIWLSIYGVPKQIHMDSPSAHRSSALTKFLEAYGITQSLGVPRRPESQGLVERLIGELKTSCRLSDKKHSTDGLTIPYWVSIQTGVLIHNSSPDPEIGMSPFELCLGQDRPFGFMDGLPDESDDKNINMIEEWNQLRGDIEDRFLLMQAWRNDKAHQKEMSSLAQYGTPPAYEPGQLVRLTRVVDGRRQVTGPYKIESKHENNPYLYKLQGSPHWYNIGQLLRYQYPLAQKRFDSATLPARAYLASMHRTSLPDDLNIQLKDLKQGDFVVTFTDEKSEELEPVRTFYISEYVKSDDSSDEIVVIGLNKSSNGRWQRPLMKERDEFTWAVPTSRILGAFKPTRQRRIPQAVMAWLQSIGVA